MGKKMYKVIIIRNGQQEEMSFTHETAHYMFRILCEKAASAAENIDEVLLTTSGYDIIKSVIF